MDKDELNINIKISLKGAYPKWTDKCYIIMQSPAFEDFLEFERLGKEKSSTDAYTKISDKFTDMFISGEGMTSSGKLVPIERDHFTRMIPKILNKYIQPGLLNSLKGDEEGNLTKSKG